MHTPASVRPQIIESLYVEALALADEVRSVFDLSELEASAPSCGDPFRVALSCEALRATTRMMHAVAWLLNQRAYLRGELTAFQLYRTGHLAPLSDRDADRVARLPLHLRQTIEESEAFYRRLMRFDRQWRDEGRYVAAPVSAMQNRLAQVFAVAS